MFVYSRFNVLSLFSISLLFISGGFLISCNHDDDNDNRKVETKEMRGYFFTLEGDTQPEDKSKAVTCDSEDVTLKFEYLDKDDKSKGARVSGSSVTDTNKFLQEGFLIKTKDEKNTLYSLTFSYVTFDESTDSFTSPGFYDLFDIIEPGGEDKQKEEYVGAWGGRPNNYDYVLWVGCSYIMLPKADAEKLDIDLSGTSSEKVQECKTKIPYFSTKTFCLALNLDGEFESYNLVSE